MTDQLTPALTLDALGDSIRSEYADAINSARDAVAHAAECGRLLTEAKTRVTHGEWLPWLAANAPEIHERTAQQWMRLGAADTATIASAHGVKQALRLLTNTKPASYLTPEQRIAYAVVEDVLAFCEAHDPKTATAVEVDHVNYGACSAICERPIPEMQTG